MDLFNDYDSDEGTDVPNANRTVQTTHLCAPTAPIIPVQGSLPHLVAARGSGPSTETGSQKGATVVSLKQVDDFVPASSTARRAAGALFARQRARTSIPKQAEEDSSSRTELQIEPTAIAVGDAPRDGMQFEASAASADAAASREASAAGDAVAGSTGPYTGPVGALAQSQPQHDPHSHGAQPPVHPHMAYPGGYPYPYAYPSYPYPYPPAGYSVPASSLGKHGRSYTVPDPSAAKHLDKRTRQQMGLDQDTSDVTGPYGELDADGHDEASYGPAVTEISAASLHGGWDPRSVLSTQGGQGKTTPAVAVRLWNSQAGSAVQSRDTSRTHKVKGQINFLAQQALANASAVEQGKLAAQKAKGAASAKYGW